MSDAMNNPYANNPNQNGSNEQQPQGQPEYGAYAPNQQSQSQQQGGNPNKDGFDSHLPSIMDFPLQEAICRALPTESQPERLLLRELHHRSAVRPTIRTAEQPIRR